MFQICHCGTQPGYPHDPRCPFPLFTDDRASVEKWNRERAALELEAGTEMPDPLDPSWPGEEGYAHRGEPCSWESAAAYAQRVMSGEAA